MVTGLNLNVLVADDNKINRLLISKIFAKWGVTADFVENGAEAVKKIESNRNYDVVLMDIHMPEMDGFEATKHLKSNPEPYFQQLPIIALTASMLEGERSMISDAGMDYILKPFDSKKLYDKLSHFQKEEALVK
jgi:CheY-like chemotaxis protein